MSQLCSKQLISSYHQKLHNLQYLHAPDTQSLHYPWLESTNRWNLQTPNNKQLVKHIIASDHATCAAGTAPVNCAQRATSDTDRSHQLYK